MSNPLSNDDDLLTFIAATIESMRDRMVTKDELEGLATKSDIARLEAKIDVGLTAVRGDIEQVHLRLDAIERALTAPLGQLKVELPTVGGEERP